MGESKNEFSVQRIAELAGVSTATVSRVLNFKDNVTKETRARVMGVLDQLGYQPQSIRGAGALQNKLLLMSLQNLHNPIAAHAVDGAQAAASQYGYQLLLVQAENLDKSIEGYLSLMKSSQAAGLILLDDLIDDGMLEKLANRIPYVLILSSSPARNVSSVSIDDYEAAVKAVNYLLSIGRRRIALLNGSAHYKYAERREAGYRFALRKAGIPVDERLIVHLSADFRMESAMAAAEGVLSAPDRPDAFFAVSDVYASAAIRTCNRFGLSVPADVAVVGFDNTSLSLITDPPITTMVQPAQQIGFMACHLLIDKIRSKNLLHKQVVLESELIVRGSTL